MSNGSKKNIKKVLKKTAGTKRGRKMKPKAPKPHRHNPLVWRRPPKMTDNAVQVLAYIFGIDGTKQEACTMAGISPTTFDEWYKGKYTISWKFKEIGFDTVGNPTQTITEREALFHEIMDHAMSQPFVRARQAQAKNIVKGKERSIETFLTTRDDRYKKKIDLEGSGIFNVTFGMPPSPHIKSGNNDQGQE